MQGVFRSEKGDVFGSQGAWKVPGWGLGLEVFEFVVGYNRLDLVDALVEDVSNFRNSEIVLSFPNRASGSVSQAGCKVFELLAFVQLGSFRHSLSTLFKI